MGQNDFFYAGGGGAAASGGGAAIQISGNTTGTTALVSSGTLVLAGGNNITLSQSGNSITILDLPSLTLQQYWPNWQGGTNTRQFGQSSVQVNPIYVPDYISVTRAQMLVSVSLSTSSNSSHAGTLSWALGIYTNNASTLSLSTSGSVSYAWTDTAGQSSASLQSQKILSLPINFVGSPGIYYLAHLSQTATANANWITISNQLMGINTPNGSFAGASSGTFNNMPGLGHWTAATAALPVSMSIAHLRLNQPPDSQMQMITFCNTTA
jgi:hypothetical protein